MHSPAISAASTRVHQFQRAIGAVVYTVSLESHARSLHGSGGSDGVKTKRGVSLLRCSRLEKLMLYLSVSASLREFDVKRVRKPFVRRRIWCSTRLRVRINSSMQVLL
jgi:hypothetical protein